MTALNLENVRVAPSEWNYCYAHQGIIFKKISLVPLRKYGLLHLGANLQEKLQFWQRLIIFFMSSPYGK